MLTPQYPQPPTLSQVKGGYLDLPDAHNSGPGILENQMETTIVYWGYIGIMEKKMETTIAFIWGSKASIVSIWEVDIGIMEKENGNYYSLHLGVKIWEVEVDLTRRQRGPREELPPRADNKVEALGL